MLFGNYEEIREPQYLVLQEMSAMQSHRLVDELHNLQIHLLHTLEAPIFSAALIPLGGFFIRAATGVCSISICLGYPLVR